MKFNPAAFRPPTRQQERQRGQSALLIVMMVSVITTSMAYFALSRNLAARKFVVSISAKARAAEALETAAGYLHSVYVSEAACDPGLLLASKAMTPFSLTATKRVQGYVVGVPAPNIGAAAQGYAAPYNQPNMDYYIVDFGPLYTLERTDLTASTAMQDILHYEGETAPGTGTLDVVYLGIHNPYKTARSPVDGPGNFYHFDKSAAPNARSLGARDMAIELSVAYPPGRNPKFTMRQHVVFHNTCEAAVFQNGDNEHSTAFFSIPDASLGTGVPLRNCAALSGTQKIGNLADNDAVRKPHHLDMLRNYLKTGFYETSALSSDQAHNCADINRDGVVSESDVGLLEKHLSGYLFYLPPIFPEYLDGTDINHKTQ